MTFRYQEIAAHLRDRIRDGTYRPGDCIPSIRELMSQFGVARDTVRDAVSRLTQEGLVTPKLGIGTVVRDTSLVPLAYRKDHVSQTWAVQTGEPEEVGDVIVRAGWDVTDPDIAERLGLTRGARVVYRVRHQRKGVDLCQIHEQWIPEEVVLAIRDATGVDLSDQSVTPPTDLFTLMRQSGNPPVEVTETIAARMPGIEAGQTLGLPPGVPVLITRRVTVDGRTRPLETSTFTGAGDRTSLSYTVPLPTDTTSDEGAV